MKIKIWHIITFVLLLIIAGTVFTVYSMFGLVQKTDLPHKDSELGIIPTQAPKVQETQATVKPDDNTAKPVKPVSSPAANSESKTARKSGILNLALYGLDRRNPDDISRSDTIMIISIDGETRKIKVTSLMRDMYVPIPGKQDNRINAAYAFGGPALSIKTINKLFWLDVRDYVTIDFTGLTNLIDKVGGVEINVRPEETRFCYVNQPGLQLLSGQQALAYSRIRYVGNADYERTQRQRTVLNLLYRKIKDQGVLKLPGTVKSLLPYVETSLSNQEILDLAMTVAGFNSENLEQFRLPVDGTYESRTIRNMMVLVPDIEKNREMLHKFIYDTK